MRQLLFIFLLALAGSLMAREVSITVQDRDLEIPLEGVQITWDQASPVYTDFEGEAVLDLPLERTLLTLVLPGYETQRFWYRGEESLDFQLVLEGFFQGEELVVEAESQTEQMEETGVSQALSNEEIENLGEIGMVEDVMSAVKALPGVGYTGGWNALPSIRGGHPGEMTAVMDGFYVRYPYHWGGGYSIFNPNIVQAAKLSHGVFSARYGQAMSGLLEISTKRPDSEVLVLDASLSTIASDFFFQTPLGEDLGLMLGGKITFLEGMLAVLGQDDQFSTAPFIRDLYTKIIYQPDPRLEIYLNGFLGTDGVGNRNEMEMSGITTEVNFDWNNIEVILSGGMKALVTDSLHITLSGGYNRHESVTEIDNTSSGTREYSQQFIDLYGGLLGGATSYTIDALQDLGTSTTTFDLGQLRLESGLELTGDLFFLLGAEVLLERHQSNEDFQVWADIPTASGFQLTQVHHQISAPGNQLLNSAGYGEFQWALLPDELELRAGLRVDHSYLFQEDFSVNTYPVFNPRVDLRWNPGGSMGSGNLTFTLGSGLFSKMTTVAPYFREEFNLEDFEFSPDRTLINVLGMRLETEDRWVFSLEGYHKEYLNRFYVNQNDDPMGDFAYYVHDDGLGRVFGADVMIQKKAGGMFDGFLSYSFVWTRLFNPQDDGLFNPYSSFPSNDPLGTWYFPNYHRTHSLNLVVNYHPLETITLSMKLSFGSGKPDREPGEVELYPATLSDGTIVERYARELNYSDELRTEFSIPVDLKLTIQDYYPGTQIRWEQYVGVENLLVAWYKPKGTRAIDPYTGSVIDASGDADFNLPFPMISFGFKVSY